jgi:hypothetical protein
MNQEQNDYFNEWLEQWRARSKAISPERYRMTKAQVILCGRLKQLGYAKDTQVRIYGEDFWLTSDPFCIGDDCVFIDAQGQHFGRPRRIRIPREIVYGAKREIA